MHTHLFLLVLHLDLSKKYSLGYRHTIWMFIQNNKIKILKSKPLSVEGGNIIMSFSILQHKIRLQNKSFKELFHCFVCSTKKHNNIKACDDPSVFCNLFKNGMQTNI